MFLKAPGNPTTFKKIVYLITTTILGLLLSFLVHAIIEMSYLNLTRVSGESITFYGQCALSPIVQLILWLLGAVGGFFLGKFWWRMVYIDRVWSKKFSNFFK